MPSGETAVFSRSVAEPPQQQVTRRMPVRVVVVLEAVEVEAGRAPLGRSRRRAASLEVVHHRAPVAEPGERVADRLVAHGPQQRRVLAEAEHQPDHHGRQRRDGERGRDRAERSLDSSQTRIASAVAGEERGKGDRAGGRVRSAWRAGGLQSRHGDQYERRSATGESR